MTRRRYRTPLYAQIKAFEDEHGRWPTRDELLVLAQIQEQRKKDAEVNGRRHVEVPLPDEAHVPLCDHNPDDNRDK